MNYRKSVLTLLATTCLVCLPSAMSTAADPPPPRPAPDVPVTTGLRLWLDANDIDGDGVPESAGEAGIVDGNVMTWVDKADADGVQSASQSNAAEQPKLVGSPHAIRPVVHFDAVDDFMKTAAFDEAIDQPMTVITVWQLDEGVTLPENNYIIYDGLAGSGHRVLLVNEFLGGPVGGNLGFFTGNFVGDNYIEFGERDGEPIVSTAEYNSPSSVLRLDGDIVMEDKTTGPDNLDGLTLGGRFDPCCDDEPRLTMNGYIAEVLVYDRLLSEADRMGVESYLAAKWQVPEPSGLALLLSATFGVQLLRRRKP